MVSGGFGILSHTLLLTLLSILPQLFVEPSLNFESGVGVGRINLSFGVKADIDLSGCISVVASGLDVEGFGHGHFLVFLVYFVFVEDRGATSHDAGFIYLEIDHLQFGNIVLFLDAGADVVQFLVEKL